MKCKLIIVVVCFSYLISCKQVFESVNASTEKPYNIVYVSDRERNNQIYLMNMDGANDTKLTHDSENYYFPQFSPDGSKILFYSGGVGNDEIFIMENDGTNQLNLTNAPGNDNLCQFSPDGSKIVFVATRDGNREIYIMNVDGSDQTRLTNNNYIDHSPQFSPDGSKIVFYRVTLTNHNDLPHTDFYDIYTVDINGENLTKLTPDSTYLIITNFITNLMSDYNQNTFDWSPRFSPDGSKITFQSYYRNHGFEVFIMESNGYNIRRLTNTEGNNSAPIFNLDGSKIIFRTGRFMTLDIYSMNLDGTDQKNLTYNSDDAFFSQFSPDGNKILFNDKNDFENSGFKYKIYIMDSDGNNRKMLSKSSFAYEDLFPSFQPNGEIN